MHSFEVSLGYESVDRSTFSMKRGMIIKVMFHIPMKLKSEIARASTTTSDVNNQWRSNFQQQIIYFPVTKLAPFRYTFSRA
jgi:hypothetical protein